MTDSQAGWGETVIQRLRSDSYRHPIAEPGRSAAGYPPRAAPPSRSWLPARGAAWSAGAANTASPIHAVFRRAHNYPAAPNLDFIHCALSAHD